MMTCIHIRKLKRFQTIPWRWWCYSRICKISPAACITCPDRRDRSLIKLNILDHPHIVTATAVPEELSRCARICAQMRGRAK